MHSRARRPHDRAEHHQAGYSPTTRDALHDCLFLGVVVLLSLMLYVRQLGFYTDDWAFLGEFAASHDQSFAGLYQSLYSSEVGMRQRPVQMLYLAGLYRLFGPHPLGYHLVNAAVLLVGIVLLYLALRELGQPRVLALAVPMVYALLPHYSTDRFWIAAFQATLSIALYFLSLYAGLRALRHGLAHPARPSVWGWKALGIAGLLGSGLAYEVALPLFLLNPVLMWYRALKLHGPARGRRMVGASAVVLLAIDLLALALVIGFKVSTTVRLGFRTGYISHLAHLAVGSIGVNYGIYGLGLPYVVWRVVHDYATGPIIAVGGALGLACFVYLYRVAGQPRTEAPRAPGWRTLVAAGLVVFALGYAIFLTNDQVVFTAAGIDNRVNIAAAVGVAMTFVGALGWASARLTSAPARRRLFCALVALLCMAGFLITDTVAAFWITAYHREEAILGDIRTRFPTLPTGSTVILDGACSTVGPARAFSTDWDLAGALIASYHDPTLRATVVTPDLKIGAGGLSILTYKTWIYYPYGEKLLLYNYKRKEVYRVTAAIARRYFSTSRPDQDCPPDFKWYK